MNRYRLLFSVSLVLLLGWFWITSNTLNRVDETDTGYIFTTKVEKVQSTDCDTVVENDAKCKTISFNDSKTDQETKMQLFLYDQGASITSSVEDGDLIRVAKYSTVEQDWVESGVQEYQLLGFDRINSYYLIVSLFILTVVAVTGMRGVRSMLSLAVSLGIIVYIIVPLTLRGSDPVLVASAVGIAMFAVLIYLTNGFNKLSTITIGGASVGILATIITTLLFSSLVNLTGFGEEEVGILASILESDFDLLGVVRAGFILGVLGVVDDASVSQVHTVAELIKHSHGKANRNEIFKSAMKVGSSHIGSLINTLFLAYVASSFALFILVSQADETLIDILSSEFIAEEIVRTVVGSLGLVLSIPASTYLACWLIKPEDVEGELHTH